MEISKNQGCIEHTKALNFNISPELELLFPTKNEIYLAFEVSPILFYRAKFLTFSCIERSYHQAERMHLKGLNRWNRKWSSNKSMYYSVQLGHLNLFEILMLKFT